MQKGCKNASNGIALSRQLTNEPHKVTMNLRGEDFSKVSGQILASANISDHNTFEQIKYRLKIFRVQIGEKCFEINNSCLFGNRFKNHYAI